MKKFSIGVIIGLLVGLMLGTATFAIANQPIKLIIDNREIACDVPPQIINDRVMVSARDVAEALGAVVTWNESNQSVFILSNRPSENGSDMTTSTESQEFSDKAVAMLKQCAVILEFAGGNGKNVDVSDAQEELDELQVLELDLRALAVPDEYEDFKSMLLEMTNSLQKTTDYLIAYLESDDSYSRLVYITKRNECYTKTLELLADCNAEMKSLKAKGLL